MSKKTISFRYDKKTLILLQPESKLGLIVFFCLGFGLWNSFIQTAQYFAVFLYPNNSIPVHYILTNTPLFEDLNVPFQFKEYFYEIPLLSLAFLYFIFVDLCLIHRTIKTKSFDVFIITTVFFHTVMLCIQLEQILAARHYGYSYEITYTYSFLKGCISVFFLSISFFTLCYQTYKALKFIKTQKSKIQVIL